MPLLPFSVSFSELAAVLVALCWFNNAVSAANDWSVPCHQGLCSYDGGDGDASAFHSFTIAGSPTSISDLTAASGWTILSCDSSSSEPQTIEIVCNSADTASAGCDHLFNGGAEHTIVRLPESCSSAPFARVVSVSQSDNARHRRRSLAAPVMTVDLDYNFHLVPTENGQVDLHLVAASAPTVFDSPAARRRSLSPVTQPQGFSRKSRRSPQGFGAPPSFGGVPPSFGASSSFGGAPRSVGTPSFGGAPPSSFDSAPPSSFSTTSGFSSAPASSFPGAGIGGGFGHANAIPSIFGGPSHRDPSRKRSNDLGLVDLMERFSDVHKRDGSGDIPIQFSNTMPLLVSNIDCPDVGFGGLVGNFNVTATTSLNADISYGVKATGSIVPSILDAFEVYTSLNGGVDLQFDIQAVANGNITTPTVPVFALPLALLSIPGIINLGPSYAVNAMVIADLATSTDMTIGAHWDLPNLEMAFPPGSEPASSNAQAGGAPLKISVDGTGNPQGNVEVHLAPRLSLGFSVIGGLVSASVYVDLDMSGKLGMDLSFSADNATVSGSDVTGSGSLNGCLDMSGNVQSVAGAQAHMTAFVHPSVTKTLFSVDAQPFQKCFGGGFSNPSRVKARSVAPHEVNVEKRDLVCPKHTGDLVRVIDEIIGAISSATGDIGGDSGSSGGDGSGSDGSGDGSDPSNGASQ